MPPQTITYNKDRLCDSIEILYQGHITERNVTSEYNLSYRFVLNASNDQRTNIEQKPSHPLRKF